MRQAACASAPAGDPRPNRVPDDAGASLLLALFAVVFVSIVVSLLLTQVDGGTRQNTQLEATQSDRIATEGVAQAAFSASSRSPYTQGTGSCPIGSGITYSDASFGTVKITCQSVTENPVSTTGGDNLNLGSDALVITNQSGDAHGGWVENGAGWVFLYGTVRVGAASSSAPGILANGKTGNPCATLQTDPTSSTQKACGQIVNAGNVWTTGTCSTGVYTVSVVGTTMTSVPSILHCQNSGAAGYISTIVGKAVNASDPTKSQLPMPPTAGVVDQSTVTPTCYPHAVAGDSTSPAMAVFPPGYYGGLTNKSPLQVAFTGGYYVPAGTTSAGAACTTTKGSNTLATTVDLSPGAYFFGLTSTLSVDNAVTVVGGAPVSVDPSGSGTTYVTCDQTNAAANGVQLVFGATAANSTQTYGISVGSSRTAVLSLCGQDNSSGAAAGGPATVVLRGLTSAQLGGAASLSVAGQKLYPDPLCSTTVSNSVSPTTCALLQNASAGGGSLNIHGFVFAPNDAFDLYTDPVCNGVSTLWGALDCEFHPGTYAVSGQGGQVALDSGLVANGLYTEVLGLAGNTGAYQGNGTKWTTSYWLPILYVPGGLGVGNLDVVFAISGTDSTTSRAFSGSAEVLFSNQNGAATKWQSLNTVAWNNW